MIKSSDKISEFVKQFNKLEERVRSLEVKITKLEKPNQKRPKK